MKTALITGASRGIGAQTARRLAGLGYAVAINYRERRDLAEETAREIRSMGADAITVQADVSKSAEVLNMFDEIRGSFGEVDVLVNNAGIAQQKLFCDITDDDFAKMMGVCVSGAFYCCRAALPAMIRKKSGRIINVSSIWGICGASCEVHYSAAKAAVIGLTKALAKEVGPSGITVNCVAPGVIETDMCAGLSDSDRRSLCDETPLMRLGTARDVAEVIAFLAGGGADFITGQVISPNGGIVI